MLTRSGRFVRTPYGAPVLARVAYQFPRLSARHLAVVPENGKAKTKKETLWEKTKATLAHYRDGTRLLGADIAIAYRLVRRVTRGKSLTRRERKLLLRTSTDVLRLFPFLFFVLVPFMEFLLPFAIRLFPNMLPSTFRHSDVKEDSLKKQIKLKLEIAQFMQDSVEELVKEKHPKMEHVLQVIRSGGRVGPDTMVEICKVFSDELTLDNLPLEQLSSLSRNVGVTPSSYRNVMVYRLESRFKRIKEDDLVIRGEGGVESLSVPELRAASRERGLRTVGVSLEQMRRALSEWLTLSVDNGIAPALLALSPVGEAAGLDGVRKTLITMDEAVVDQAKLRMGDEDIDSLRREDERIQKEQIETDKIKTPPPS